MLLIYTDKDKNPLHKAGQAVQPRCICVTCPAADGSVFYCSK